MPGKKWEEWEDKILEEKYPDCSARIPGLAHRSKDSIQCRARKRGIRFTGKRPRTRWVPIGTKRETNTGYIFVKAREDHPLVNKYPGDYGVYEHRLAWWDAHPEDRQALLSGATIHHRNGKRADNKLENLQIRYAGKHPKGITLQDMIHTLESKGYEVFEPYIL